MSRIGFRVLTQRRGFAIVSAIILLVVFAALGVGMLVFTKNQQTESAYDVQGSRAYQAARTGIEWALYRRLNAGCIQTGCTPTWCATSTPLQIVTMPAGTTLSQFTVSVQCTATITNVQAPDQISGQLNPVVIRTIDSFACIQPTGSGGNCSPTAGGSGLDNVQRHLQVSIQQTN